MGGTFLDSGHCAAGVNPSTGAPVHKTSKCHISNTHTEKRSYHVNFHFSCLIRLDFKSFSEMQNMFLLQFPSKKSLESPIWDPSPQMQLCQTLFASKISTLSLWYWTLPSCIFKSPIFNWKGTIVVPVYINWHFLVQLTMHRLPTELGMAWGSFGGRNSNDII